MRSARRTVDSRWATTIVVRPRHQPLERPLDDDLGAGVEVASSPRRARAPPGRPARPGRATRAGARRPTGASRARAPRCARPSRERRRTGRARRSRRARRARRRRSPRRGRCARCRRSCRRTGSPPAARRRCARAATRASASRRSTPPNVTVPVGRVVQARHQLGERRLAGAGRADERQPLAVADRERHVDERRRVDVPG